jgi:hypothetical protein
MYNRIEPEHEHEHEPIEKDHISVDAEVYYKWAKMIRLFRSENPHVSLQAGGEAYSPQPNGDIIMSVKGINLSMVIKGEEWSWAE